MRALLALLVLISAAPLTSGDAFAAVQGTAPTETPALMAARRLYAKALKEPQGEQGTAAINARWTLATQLVENSQFAEGEAEFRALETILLPRLGAEDRNLIAIQSQIANAQLGQEKWADVAETALPAYQRALALYGPDHATTHELRMAMASSLANLRRYAESEPYARAGFDYLRRTGGDQDAADIAATLALIYDRLDRPDEARAVMRLVEGDDPIRRLFNDAERLEDPADEARAWQRVLDALPADDERRIDVEVKRAFALAMSASSENPGPARDAIASASILLAHAEANGLTELRDQANQILAMGLGLLDDDAAAGEQARAIALERLETARRTLGEDHKSTIDARLYYAMMASLEERPEIVLAQLDLVDAWIEANPGAFDAQTVAFAAMARAAVLGDLKDLGGAYRAMARATGAMQSVALERIDQSRRAYLDHWGRLFQVQVKWAWRYSADLEVGPAGTPTPPAD